MLREFFVEQPSFSERMFAWSGLAVIVCHALFSAYIKFSINHWYTSFYDTLQTSGSMLVTNATTASALVDSPVLAESRHKVWSQLVLFLQIVAPAVVVNPAARWVRSNWSLHWRMALMKAYMAAWDANVPPIEGASQRLHEDTQRFSKGIDTYAAVLLNSACTLAAFTPILLSLGERVLSPPLLSSFGRSWMLVSAVLSALIGLGVAMFTGRHLVELEVRVPNLLDGLWQPSATHMNSHGGYLWFPAGGQPES